MVSLFNKGVDSTREKWSDQYQCYRHINALLTAYCHKALRVVDSNQQKEEAPRLKFIGGTPVFQRSDSMLHIEKSATQFVYDDVRCYAPQSDSCQFVFTPPGYQASCPSDYFSYLTFLKFRTKNPINFQYLFYSRNYKPNKRLIQSNQ